MLPCYLLLPFVCFLFACVSIYSSTALFLVLSLRSSWSVVQVSQLCFCVARLSSSSGFSGSGYLPTVRALLCRCLQSVSLVLCIAYICFVTVLWISGVLFVGCSTSALSRSCLGPPCEFVCLCANRCLSPVVSEVPPCNFLFWCSQFHASPLVCLSLCETLLTRGRSQSCRLHHLLGHQLCLQFVVVSLLLSWNSIVCAPH